MNLHNWQFCKFAMFCNKHYVQEKTLWTANPYKLKGSSCSLNHTYWMMNNYNCLNAIFVMHWTFFNGYLSHNGKYEPGTTYTTHWHTVSVLSLIFVTLFFSSFPCILLYVLPSAYLLAYIHIAFFCPAISRTTLSSFCILCVLLCALWEGLQENHLLTCKLHSTYGKNLTFSLPSHFLQLWHLLPYLEEDEGTPRRNMFVYSLFTYMYILTVELSFLWLTSQI